MRSFRGMIAGNSDKRGFFRKFGRFLKGAVNKAKNLLGLNARKAAAKKISKAIEQAKLTGKAPKLPIKLPPPRKPKFSQLHTKLLAWNWRPFVKGYKYEGKTICKYF